MDLTEVVSPSIAVPVICVLVCLLVFAFGFKSPTQPPNFDVFDEDAKKRKGKKSKGAKTLKSNGHTVTASGDHEAVPSVKPTASPKQSAKQTAKPLKTTPTSAAPVEKKSKKSAPKEQPAVQQEKKSTLNEDDFYAEGWETVPKKEKKQKKKDVEPKQESPAREEPVVVREAEVAMAIEPVVEALPPPSPDEQRGKKKKEKKNKKVKEEIVEQPKPQSTPVEAEVTPAAVKLTPPAVAMETVAAPAPVDEPSIETQIQEAMEMTVEKASPITDKKKNKKKKKAAAEEDDFVIPDSALKPVSSPVTEVEPSPALVENTEALTVKSSKKKQKKDKSKRLEEKLEESLTGAADNSQSLSTVSKEPQKAESHAAVMESRAVAPAVDPVPDGGEPAPSFDEMGAISESWTEAKPKGKKKKARRAD